MKNYSLVIIDMQAGFYAANQSSLQKPIVREIELAKKHNRDIIVVTFDGYCKPKKYIIQALKNYPHKSFVNKSELDGSEQVAEYINVKDNKFCCDYNIRICGVNASECVFKTACGLSEMGFNIYLVKDACGDCSAMNSSKRDESEYIMKFHYDFTQINILYKNRNLAIRK